MCLTEGTLACTSKCVVIEGTLKEVYQYQQTDDMFNRKNTQRSVRVSVTILLDVFNRRNTQVYLQVSCHRRYSQRSVPVSAN